MVTKQFRNPQALSSTLAALRMLQLWDLGFLNRLVTLVLVSNFYIKMCFIKLFPFVRSISQIHKYLPLTEVTVQLEMLVVINFGNITLLAA